MQSKFASVIHYNLLFYNEQVYYTRRYIGSTLLRKKNNLGLKEYSRVISVCIHR